MDKNDLTRDLEADMRFILNVRKHVGKNRDDLLDEFWGIGDFAWPIAIQRAIKAEERVRQLEGEAPNISTKCIWTDSLRLSGRPCLRDTRFPLSKLLAELAYGRSLHDIAEDFSLDLSLCQGALDDLAVYLEGGR
jgi:uncharacterized protein (DUF433 family)